MARFRNTSGEAREIPAVGPGRVVGDDELFEVPDELAEAFAAQPWFTREEPAKKGRQKAQDGHTQDPTGGGIQTPDDSGAGSTGNPQQQEDGA